MNMQDAFLTCLKKYAVFSGRASRSEYWWFALSQLLIGMGASIVSDTLGALVVLYWLVQPSVQESNEFGLTQA